VPLFVAGAALALPRLFRGGGAAGPPRVALVFALVLGAAWLAGVALAGDSNLGYARNWDLLAPAALVLTAAGTLLLLAAPLAVRPRRFVLAALVAVSLFHTAPWVAVNASFARSFARFKTLPLGGGRTESTVGYWYATHGELDEAEWWLERALEQNPANSRAQYLLGKVWMSTRHYAQAVAAFSAARLERPDLDVFRVALVDALFRSQRRAAALAEVDTLLVHDPRAARFWAIRGVILLGLERRDDARAALERARTLEPDVAVYRALESQAETPGAQLAMRWDELVAQ